jgi:enoyl-CoA hydratase/carnithine racemase
MKATQPVYFTTYRSLKLSRDVQGVLVVEFHTKGGPLTFTAQDHTDFVDAFYRISQDRENKIVILTGAGGEFIPGIDFATFGNVADPEVWSQVHDEGVQILKTWRTFRVPLQRPAHRRLTQEPSFRRTGDVALLQKRMEGIDQVQIQVM